MVCHDVFFDVVKLVAMLPVNVDMYLSDELH